MISWLAEEEDLISDPRQGQQAAPIVLTAAQSQLVFWLPVVVLPGRGVVVLRHRRDGARRADARLAAAARMSWKTLIVLVVLAAGLGGFFVYDTYWLAPAREKSEAPRGGSGRSRPKDVEAVTIKRKTDTDRGQARPAAAGSSSSR